MPHHGDAQFRLIKVHDEAPGQRCGTSRIQGQPPEHRTGYSQSSQALDAEEVVTSETETEISCSGRCLVL